MQSIKVTDNDIRIAKEIIFQFKKHKTKKEIFYNFCFCVLVPQARFTTVSKVVQRLIESKFYESLMFEKESLLLLIKEIRFKSRKVEFLLSLKNDFESIYVEFLPILRSDADPLAKRKWLVNRIYGMGMKSASHFLRNNGEDDLAIIDTHVLKFLNIETKKFDYLKTEEEFKKQAKKYQVTVAVLDALVWKLYSGVEWDKFVY